MWAVLRGCAKGRYCGAAPRGGTAGRRAGVAHLLELGRDEEAPVDERVVHKGLEHGHDAVPVVAEHAHGRLARRAEVALDAAHLVRVRVRASLPKA